jgi:hypothetical protein
MKLKPCLMVVVIVIIVIVAVMDDHNLVMVLVVTITMMKHDNLVVLIVTIMMMNLDNFAMMVPIPVFVPIADLDGYAAFLCDHDRLVDCGRPGQRRSAQDCKRARDKYQFVHMTFLHRMMLFPCAPVKRRCRPVARYATRKARKAAVSSSAFEKV